MIQICTLPNVLERVVGLVNHVDNAASPPAHTSTTVHHNICTYTYTYSYVCICSFSCIRGAARRTCVNVVIFMFCTV